MVEKRRTWVHEASRPTRVAATRRPSRNNGAFSGNKGEMKSSSDAEVIERSRHRNEEFEAIFDRHAPQILRYLRLRVGDHLAEELTAETFTQAFRSRERFSAIHGSALPWLYGIAGNLVPTHSRCEQRRLDAYARSASLRESAAPGSDVGLELIALTPVLSRALSVLPAGQREVLLLHAWADLSHEEIGEVSRDLRRPGP
jgi:RNA polymerase sigma-70 factor (ECF subfamily)